MPPMTLTENILARHAGRESVRPGDNLWADVDVLMTHDVCGPGTIGVFKLVDDGGEAVRVNAKLGRASVNTIEVLSGLRAGDKVILSDMSQWDNFDRIRLR